MELHVYTQKSRGGGGSESKMGILNINRIGVVGINVFLQRTLSLQLGYKMLIARDIESRNDWYVSFSDSTGEGYALKYLRVKKPEAGMTTRYHTEMTQELLASVKAQHSASFYIATGSPKTHNGRTWYRILTSNPKFIR